MRLRYLWPAIILVAAACSGDSDATPTPATATDAPAAVTDAPTAVATEAPADATEAPADATEAPADATEAPADATEAPADATEVPAAATEVPADAGGDEAATADTATAAGMPEQCASPPYDVEIRREGDGENEVFTVADAEDNGNYVREDGAIGYKIFLTDFGIVDEEPLLDQVFLENLPADATLITLDLARFEDPDDPTPVEEYPNLSAGEPIVFTNDERGPDVVGAKVTIATADGTTTDVSVNPSATGEVLYADDTAVCVDVTIESEAGFQFSGVVSARVR